ncbi:PilS cassette [Neisseria meningitidis serogroup B]|uniref:PilS cassette n=1 Tax=Neisseria meningitidis serogroup B TaxID=491 RepID=A0A0H5QBC8_NEIMI|nr:PilS cassette [Neisseria meningitidis serogroup B]
MFPVIPSKTENRKQRRKLKIPSFPRRRESRISMPQEFIGKNQNPSVVIPTKVGI